MLDATVTVELDNGKPYTAQPVPLPKPIQAHGREVEQLTLRPLAGKDLRICGAPNGIGGNAPPWMTGLLASVCYVSPHCIQGDDVAMLMSPASPFQASLR